MDDRESALAEIIGQRVRLLRQQRGWTLDQLAEASRISRRTIVNVEKGATNPSVGILLKLADALGGSLSALVDAPDTPDLTVTRDGDGAVLWTGEHGGRGLLTATSGAPGCIVESWTWTLMAGEGHETPPHRAGTREHVQVLQGAVRIRVGGTDRPTTHPDAPDQDATEVVLHPGDALAFPGDLPHAYLPEAAPACFHLTVIEPSEHP